MMKMIWQRMNESNRECDNIRKSLEGVKLSWQHCSHVTKHSLGMTRTAKVRRIRSTTFFFHIWVTNDLSSLTETRISYLGSRGACSSWNGKKYISDLYLPLGSLHLILFFCECGRPWKPTRILHSFIMSLPLLLLLLLYLLNCRLSMCCNKKNEEEIQYSITRQ